MCEKTVQIFLEDGTAEGIKTAKIPGTKIEIAEIPRTKLFEIKKLVDPATGVNY